MEIVEIYTRNAAYVRDSGFSVDVCESMGTVAIEDAEGEGFFMQGDEASDFIEAANEAWEKVGTMSLDDVYLAHAQQYVDAL